MKDCRKAVYISTWLDHRLSTGSLFLHWWRALSILYGRAARFDFINFDDGDYVIENPHVLAGLSFQSIGWAFTTGYASNWHPLTWLSLMGDVQLFGPHPGPIHAENVLLHAANAALLFVLLLRLTSARWAAAWVAAMFAWHPLHVESVAWISERKDVLSTFFLLLCLLAYVRYVRWEATKDVSLRGDRFTGAGDHFAGDMGWCWG